MSSRLHIVVVGAGIVGAAVAEALALDGARVTVVEQAIPGRGASAAGMGHIVVMDDSEPQIALTSYSQRLWNERGPSLPVEAERIVCGTIWVAADEEEMAEVHRKLAFYANRNVAAQALSPAELYAAEPNLRPGLAGGLLVPGDSVVYPPTIAKSMLARVEAEGGQVMLSQRVVAMSGHAVELADGHILECDYAVNAAGTAAVNLLGAGDLGEGLQIRPRKGHLVITDRSPGFVKHQLVELGYLKSAHASTSDSVAFNVQPRPNGQVLIGSSRQYGNDSPQIDFPILAKMIQRAVGYMPGIAQLPAIRAWTGFRAATPDKIPLIGPHPKDSNLLLATGHEGLGITTSLGTAALIADYVAGRETGISLEPYLPARFSHRSVAHA